jgi:6-phosphofructokinase 1
MKARNLMIVQGGGPTAVLNASLASAIAEGISQTGIGKIFGARFGIKGLVQDDLVDLSRITPNQLSVLRDSPGAALGSSRFKPTGDDLHHLVDHLRQHDIRHIIFMGGNGTMRGAEVVSAFCRSVNLDVQVMGVPKTVDNDIALTDRCPGYASAARYVAQSTRDLGMDIRSLPQPVTIFETLGRSVGWLAAASSLAKIDETDAPHLVYVPELPFHQKKFLVDLNRVVTRQGWAVVVVSEGIRNQDGSLVYQMSDPSQLDPLKRPMTGGVGHFLAGVVAENLKIRCRTEKPGLIGRASIAHVSRQDRQDAELVGRAGVRALLAGETDRMVALRPLEDAGDLGYDLVPLSATAGIERSIPAEWLTDGPLAVTDAFSQYLRPLVGKLFRYSPALPSGLQSMGAS